MIESYVDLAYRGLSLARRVKLTSVRPREGYVETAQPMPVGTPLRLSTDEGVAIEARVIAVTEQTGGPNGAPGMQIAPVLDGAAASWWSARVALPDAPPPPKRLVIQPTTPVAAPAMAAAPMAPVIAKSNTAPMPALAPPVVIISTPPATTLASEIAHAASAMDAATIPMPIIDDADDSPQSKRTIVMDAVVADELLAQIAAEGNPRASTSPPVIVDDGRSTTVMEAVDLSALGLEPSSSGSLRMTTQVDAIDTDGGDDDKSKPTAAGKKKRKRR